MAEARASLEDARRERAQQRDAFETVWRFFCSLKWALGLILVIVGASIAGTILPQMPAGLASDPVALNTWLQQVGVKYGSRTDLFNALGLFNVYRSFWFRLLLALLIFTIVVCTADRLGRIWRTVTQPRLRMSESFFVNSVNRADFVVGAAPTGVAEELRSLFRRKRFRVLVEQDQAQGTTYLFADRFRFAKFGTIFTHLSLVLLLAGAVVGNLLGFRDTGVALFPNQVYNVGHGKAFQVKFYGFDMDTYDNGMPKDYRTDLAIVEGGREVVRDTVRVNHPLTYEGVKVSQASFGPMMTVSAKDGKGQTVNLQPYDGSQPQQPSLLLTFRGGQDEDFFQVPSRNLSVRLAYYQGLPQMGINSPVVYVQAFENGKSDPAYSGLVRKQETVDVQDLKLSLGLDHYTVVQVASDPGWGLIFTAFVLMMLGLFTSFYFFHTRIWTRITPTAEGTLVRVAGLSDKNRVAFKRDFAKLSHEIEQELGG